MREDTGTLKEGEVHPATYIARKYILRDPLKLMQYQEALASCALADDRMAEVCCETLRRLLASEPVSDRYLMGLAWLLWSMDE